MQLRTGRVLSLKRGNQFSVSDIPGLTPQQPNQIVALVSTHPQDPEVLGLQNLSTISWTSSQAGGDNKRIDPGRSIKLTLGTQVDFGSMKGVATSSKLLKRANEERSGDSHRRTGFLWKSVGVIGVVFLACWWLSGRLSQRPTASATRTVPNATKTNGKPVAKNPQATNLQQDEDWIGKRFMPKFGESASPGFQGQQIKSLDLPYTVRNVKGDELWIGRAWVKKDDIVSLDAAVAYYTDFLKDNVESAWGFYNRGITYLENGDLENAIKDFSEAIHVQPDEIESYNARAVAWERKGDMASALNDYTAAIQIAGDNPTPYLNRATIWAKRGELDRAYADCSECLRLDPNNVTGYVNRGIICEMRNDLEGAHKDMNEALRLDPADKNALLARGRLWSRKGEYQKSQRDLNLALGNSAHLAAANSGVAWFLATCPDATYRNGHRAVELATKACELTNWVDATYLDVLAAAYAEVGDFVNAVAWAEKALGLASGTQKEGVRFRLNLFKAGKAFREKVS